MTKKRKLHKTAEGKIFLVANLMSLLLIGVIGYFAINNLELTKALGLVFIAHTLGGRAAGIGLCFVNEFSLFWTIFYNFYLEVVIVSWTYSLFVLSAHNYIQLRVVRFYSIKLERKARIHKDIIAKYGWFGVFLFVMTPLPVTGPVVGSIIGYLLKFRILSNFSATFLGTLAAIVVWTYFFDFLNQHLHIIQYVLIAIIVIVVLTYLKRIKTWITG
ncbi:MAG: small multi-drug export protein [Thermodesulfobacteriota bacterium]|nr:small multi-drug export protein [Thermodesulfobacteriota bacterium]